MTSTLDLILGIAFTVLLGGLGLFWIIVAIYNFLKK